jgi:hypothetical protein
MTTFSFWYAGLNMLEFAERLRSLRESRQLTQVRLAELVGVDPRAYNHCRCLAGVS